MKMVRNPLRWVGRSLGVALVAVAAACAEQQPLGLRDAGAEAKAPALGACTNLAAREGTKVSFRAYATGAQVYRWDGASWVFVAPDAGLFADAGFHGKVGDHFAGPTWRSNSGSTVVASVLDRCTPDASAIPWLILGAVSSAGPGPFDGATHIQRLNTTGGLAPSTPGTMVGEIRSVPYTALYVFYRAR